jgi:aryl carrier-like protein
MRLTRVLHNGKLNTVKKFRLKNGGKVGLWHEVEGPTIDEWLKTRIKT